LSKSREFSISQAVLVNLATTLAVPPGLLLVTPLHAVVAGEALDWEGQGTGIGGSPGCGGAPGDVDTSDEVKGAERDERAVASSGDAEDKAGVVGENEPTTAGAIVVCGPVRA